MWLHAAIIGGGGEMTKKNVILPLKFSLKGALSHTVVPTLPWLLSHHIFGHIYIFTEFFLFLLQACTLTWFQFSILSQNIVPWLSNFDSSFALLTTYVFGDQILKVVDKTSWVSNNFFFGLIQVWGHTGWCGLKLKYLKKFWNGIVLNFESFFCDLLDSVGLVNKNGRKD